MTRITTTALAALAASALLAACTDASAADGTGDDAAADGTIEVIGVDYGFDGLPETAAAGSTLTFRNGSDAEFHEMAVMRLADDEERSVDELLALPPEEAMASMTFVGVAAAAPGETGEVIEGDLTLEEAGRYVLTCFVPVGADPAVVAEAFGGAEGEDGPPDMGDGPPHAVQGMVAELIVE